MVAGFLLNAALAVVQLTSRSEGLFGLFCRARALRGRPTLNDLLETPSTAALRALRRARRAGHARPCRPPSLDPAAPFLFGTMMGGAGAFLRLGALAMPLALAIVLHMVSPRGSRESLSDRLGHPARGAWSSCS